MLDLSNENVIHIKDGDIEYLQFRKLLEYKDKLNHCYTLKTNNKDYKEVNEAFNYLYENGYVKEFGVSNMNPMQIELYNKKLKHISK